MKVRIHTDVKPGKLLKYSYGVTHLVMRDNSHRVVRVETDGSVTPLVKMNKKERRRERAVQAQSEPKL